MICLLITPSSPQHILHYPPYRGTPEILLEILAIKLLFCTISKLSSSSGEIGPGDNGPGGIGPVDFCLGKHLSEYTLVRVRAP